MDSGVYGTQIIDFISGNLTVAGMIVNVFLTLITSLFIVVMLRIVYIDLDSGKENHLKNRNSDVMEMGRRDFSSVTISASQNSTSNAVQGEQLQNELQAEQLQAEQQQEEQQDEQQQDEIPANPLPNPLPQSPTNLDGPMTRLVNVQILFLIEQLGTQIIYFISGNLTAAGVNINVFLVLITMSFIVVSLWIVYIDLDKSANARTFKHLSYAAPQDRRIFLP